MVLLRWDLEEGRTPVPDLEQWRASIVDRKLQGRPKPWVVPPPTRPRGERVARRKESLVGFNALLYVPGHGASGRSGEIAGWRSSRAFSRRDVSTGSFVRPVRGSRSASVGPSRRARGRFDGSGQADL